MTFWYRYREVDTNAKEINEGATFHHLEVSLQRGNMVWLNAQGEIIIVIILDYQYMNPDFKDCIYLHSVQMIMENRSMHAWYQLWLNSKTSHNKNLN